MSKQISIYLSRALTFNRPGQDPLKLQAGHNTVDQEVADDDFVKHFMTAEPVDVNEVHDLRARIAELEEKHDAACSDWTKARQRIADLETDLSNQAKASSEEISSHTTRITDLEALLAEKDAELAAKDAELAARPAAAAGKSK